MRSAQESSAWLAAPALGISPLTAMHYSSESTSVVPTPSLQVSHCPILLDCVHNLLWPTDSHFNTLNKRSNLWRISLLFGSIMSGTVTVWTKGPDFERGGGYPGTINPIFPKLNSCPAAAECFRAEDRCMQISHCILENMRHWFT